MWRLSGPSRFILLLLATLLIGFGMWRAGTRHAGADWVFRNGNIYTPDGVRSLDRAVAVRGTQIIYVGEATGVTPLIDSATRTVDLAGRMLLPAFHDAHVHMLAGGVLLNSCNLAGVRGKEAILAAIATYAASHPNAAWIAGAGWALGAFPAANPRREDLDRIVPDRPVFLVAEDGHSAWVNSRALQTMQIDRHTPDPPRGRIERDAQTGEPSGTLRETAMDPVQDVAFDVGPWQGLRSLHDAVAQANRLGIVSFIEARASTSEYDLAYRLLDLMGLLNARVNLSLWLDPQRAEEQLDEFVRRRRWDITRHVRADTIKIFVDGVPESRTGYLLTPYEGGSDRGEANFDPARLASLAGKLDAADFQLHFHATGDAAARLALDTVANVRATNGWRDTRPHIAHLQMVAAQDWPRFQDLGVSANIQALWAFPEPEVMALDHAAIGVERTQQVYPFGALQRAGARLAGGSDWPVSSMDPLAAIQVALTRRDPRLEDGAVLGADQRVDLATMIDAYTQGGAYLQHEDASSGTIAVGKLADLVVLDHDLCQLPVGEIAGTRVLLTLFEGRAVYQTTN